jgi:hypothetical protein
MSTKMSLAKSIQLDAKEIKKGNPAVFKLSLFESRATTIRGYFHAIRTCF